MDKRQDVVMAKIVAGLAAASPDALICADSTGRVVYWNDAAATMFGVSRAAAIGQSLDMIMPEPMRGAHMAGIKRLAAGGTPRIVGRVVEVIAQHSDGRTFPIEMSLAQWSEQGRPTFGAMIRDVSERRRNEERLHHLAHFDQLTLLPNRTMFIERLEAALGNNPATALLLVDLDRFKEVNDFFGHAAGDRVLRETAVRLKHCVTDPEATVSRLGGDEFAVLFPGSGDPLAMAGIADKIRQALNNHFEVEGRSVFVGCSIGIALSPVHGVTPDELISSADLALYRAKAEGGDRRQVFMPNLRENATARRMLEDELARAVANREFELFYQPQIRLGDGSITGVEALLRWRHPERGLLAPGAFIKVLEATKLAEQVGQWVLDTACRQAALWQRQSPGFRVGVNLFEVQLRADRLLTNVAGVLASSGLEPSSLELEITENVLLSDDEAWVSRIGSLRKLGIGLAFDDYGTGYASLSLLKRFPLTRLKVDRSFVRDLATDPDDAAIVEAVVSLGRRFHLGVIAEGVETREQERLLKNCGCEEAQGYLYGKPMPADDLTQLLLSNLPSAHRQQKKSPLRAIGRSRGR